MFFHSQETENHQNRSMPPVIPLPQGVCKPSSSKPKQRQNPPRAASARVAVAVAVAQAGTSDSESQEEPGGRVAGGRRTESAGAGLSRNPAPKASPKRTGGKPAVGRIAHGTHDVEELRRVTALLQQGKTAPEVATETNIPVGTVRKWKAKSFATGELSPHLHSVSRPFHPETRTQALALLAQGKHKTEIAAELNVSERSVLRWRAESRASPQPNRKINTAPIPEEKSRAHTSQAFALFREGKTVEEVAEETQLAVRTVSTWYDQYRGDAELNLEIARYPGQKHDRETRARACALLDQRPPKSPGEVAKMMNIPLRTVFRWSQERNRRAVAGAPAEAAAAAAASGAGVTDERSSSPSAVTGPAGRGSRMGPRMMGERKSESPHRPSLDPRRLGPATTRRPATPQAATAPHSPAVSGSSSDPLIDSTLSAGQRGKGNLLDWD